MIVGKIVERSASPAQAPTPPRPPSATSSRAFPPVQHRSLRPSRFGSDSLKLGESSTSSSKPARSYEELGEVERIQQAADEENQRRVADMTAEEREEEVRELKERFGPGLEDLMRRRRRKRQQQPSPTEAPASAVKPAQQAPQLGMEGGLDENTARVQAMSERERAQEVAELEERFGATTIDKLRQRALQKQKQSQPRPDTDKPAVSKSKSPPPPPPDGDEALDLKAKYFPDLPAEPDKMAWMRPSGISAAVDDDSPRFDLNGRRLSKEEAKNLPADRGLHHHGSSPDLAGYTSDEIVHLCQSTVPSQRITMMGVLSRIIASYVLDQVDNEVKQIVLGKRLCEQATNLAVGGILLMSKSAGIFRAAIGLFYESLGAAGWTWMDERQVTPFRPTESHVDLSGIPWEDVVPTFGEMLATDALSPRTTTQIVRVLRRLAVLSDEHCELVTPLLPEIVRSHVLLRPWPSTTTSIPPSTDALSLVNDIIVSSRRCAAALADQGIIEPLLKFPLTLTWDDNALGQELAREGLSILGSLARYGLATSIAKSGAEPVDRLRDWLRTSDAPGVAVEYWRLLRTWTVCATDPHKTTPEHDLTWAQISAMGWIDDALRLVERYLTESKWLELPGVLKYVVAYLEGAEINEVERGSTQKSKVLDSLRDLNMAGQLLSAGPSSQVVIAQAIRLHLLMDNLISHDQTKTLVELNRNSLDPDLRYQVIRLAQAAELVDPATRATMAFEIMTVFEPGSEPDALDLLDIILRTDYTGRVDDLASLPSDGLQILRPLLQYTILPDLTNAVGPSRPRPEYLKPTMTLRPNAQSGTQSRHGTGLPLGSDWFFSPLDELLRSATSAALAQTPPDWDPSELDLVRATLMLAQTRVATAGGIDSCLSRSQLLLNLMKVFMLEHGQQTPTNHSETDLFRDPIISKSISALISLTFTLTLAAPLAAVGGQSSTLEQACVAFLGPETPFFQWYTDFVALYESVSFGDTAFTQLLIPPLAMTYPVDFRQLFWDEHTSILRGVRLRAGEIPLEQPNGLEAFFQPVETDQAVLDGMIRAAGKDWLREGTFLRTMAVHHVASVIWTRRDDKDEEMVKRVLVGVLSTCPDMFVREIMTHNLTEGADEQSGLRRELVERLAGVRGLQRLDRLSL